MRGWGSDVWNEQLARRYIISTVGVELGGVIRWETLLLWYRNFFSRPRLLTVHPISEEAARLVHEWLRAYAENQWLALERPEYFQSELSLRPYLWGLLEEGPAVKEAFADIRTGRSGAIAKATQKNREEVQQEIRKQEWRLIQEIERLTERKEVKF
jgi:hypothetical protein